MKNNEIQSKNLNTSWRDFGYWRDTFLGKIFRHRHCFLMISMFDNNEIINNYYSCSCGFRILIIKGFNDHHNLKRVDNDICPFLYKDILNNSYIVSAYYTSS